MSKVDWSKAPSDAEFYAGECFYKMVGCIPYFFSYEDCLYRESFSVTSELIGMSDYEKRPEKQATDVSKALCAWGFNEVDGFSVKLPSHDFKEGENSVGLGVGINCAESKVNQAKPEKDGNKYHREIIGFCGTMVEVDVYRVLDAFKTESPAIDHAVKKMLCTGIRGHKDYLTDIDNAIESLQEAKLLYLQKQEINKA